MCPNHQVTTAFDNEMIQALRNADQGLQQLHLEREVLAGI